ncbi:MAG: sigma-70 family RNA polymerase sigma factor [Patescibacteria group bacterium]
MTKKQETAGHARMTIAHHDFNKGLNSYALFKVSDSGVSQDLVQDTFLKTWKYLVKGGKIDIMKAFLYHILNNLIVDEYRKHKTTSLEVFLEKGVEPSTGDSESLFNTLDAQALTLLIHRLPDVYRKVMRMRYVQDLSLKEMALLTGLSKNTMAVQVHRGVEKLKVLYTEKSHLAVI